MKLLALASLGLALTACGSDVPPASTAAAVPTVAPVGPFPSELVQGLRTETDVAFTDVTECGGTPCRVPGDVIAPAADESLPTVVLLPGGGKLFPERRYQQDLAVELARRGAVVFLMSYRGIATANYDSHSRDDARCAVRFARAHTAEYGGDPSRVVIVGHSQGGLMGMDLALQPDEEVEACLAGGSSRPDGVIALGSPRPQLGQADDSVPPIWLFAGSDDGDADGVAERLREAGFDAESHELPGVTHDGITDPSAAPEIIDLIMEALSSV